MNLETEKVLPPNRIGEIRFRSKFIGKRYYNNEESLGLESDGFMKTGDIGYYDDDNCLYVVDRIKEMFKYRSWHIVPASLEQVLYEHAAIKEAVIIGIPAEEDGEHPMALVVLKDGYNTTETDIKQFVDGRVIEREKLRAGVKILEEIPKTPTGKFSRIRLREMVLSKRI